MISPFADAGRLNVTFLSALLLVLCACASLPAAAQETETQAETQAEAQTEAPSSPQNAVQPEPSARPSVIRIGISEGVSQLIAPCAQDGNLNLECLARLTEQLLQGGHFPQAEVVCRIHLAVRPADNRARLNLAIALYRQDKKAQSKSHFESALAAGLSPELATRVREILREIRQGRVWSLSGGMSFTPQSNATGGTHHETLNFFGLPFSVSEDDQGQAGVYVKGYAAGGLRPPLGDSYAGRATLYVSTGKVMGTEVDTQWISEANGKIGIDFSGTKGRIGGGAGLGGVSRDNELDSFRRGLWMDYAYLVSDQIAISGSASVDRVYFKSNPDLEAWDSKVTLRGNYRTSNVLRWFAEVPVAYILRGESSANYWARGLTLGFHRRLPRRFQISASAGYERKTHPIVSGLWGVKRKDETFSVSATITNDTVTVFGFAPKLELEAYSTTSNIILYEKRNASVSLGLSRSF